jgi:CheY-like chemotaxis protein
MGAPAAHFAGHSADRLRSPSLQSGLGQDQPLVLVIDDDRDARIIWTTCLAHLGYSTATETNAEDGVRAALQHRPLAILMDLGMPDLEGLEATRRIKALARTHDCLVIVVTGRGTDFLEQARAAGCDAYFCKPFNAFLLEAIVRISKALGEHERKTPRIRRCACRREYTPDSWSRLQFCGRIFRRMGGCSSSGQALEVRICPCGSAITMSVGGLSQSPQRSGWAQQSL